MTTGRKRIGPAQNPWEPHPLTKYDCYAVRALMEGKASEGQQRRIWELLFAMTGARDLEFRPGGEEGRRASDFASGKRFIGLQLAKIITLPASVVEKLD